MAAFDTSSRATVHVSVRGGGILCIVANEAHHVLRRRFSFAHEYAHVLLDRGQVGTISRSSERDDLAEVRANSFAACFLMPEDGVRNYVGTLGKGRPSRAHVDVFDEEDSLAAAARVEPRYGSAG